MVASLVNGVNATVLAFGQTGSGKTHTMMGGSTGGPPSATTAAAGAATTSAGDAGGSNGRRSRNESGNEASGTAPTEVGTAAASNNHTTNATNTAVVAAAVEPGLIPLAVADVFARLRGMAAERDATVTASYVEVGTVPVGHGAGLWPCGVWVCGKMGWMLPAGWLAGLCPRTRTMLKPPRARCTCKTMGKASTVPKPQPLSSSSFVRLDTINSFVSFTPARRSTTRRLMTCSTQFAIAT